MTDSVTVHVVFQSHLDPVWLWPWEAGMDEALATARTTCDLLDTYDDFIFSSGEAWRYRQIELADPALFRRIRRHVRAGRWEVVGGWWVQPDCNQPSGFAMEKQIAIGREYVRDRFGSFPEVAYNVDSFGHAAALPGYLRAAGQRYYVMMRPQEHEMKLPARLFRWRGYRGGPEVVVFRIAGSYGSGPDEISVDHVSRALTELPPGVKHTMCFAGVGDHGGGATAKLIEWVREHHRAVAGCRLVFSSPSRFFRRIGGQRRAFPLVTGELQYHAIGCYSVLRGIKTRVRRAEHRLRQANLMHAAWAPASVEPSAIGKAWQHVCLNHFHDVLGGTCIPSAYAQQFDQLGAATAAADEVLQYGFRRAIGRLPADPLQRMVFCNASDAPFAGPVEYEPWLMWHAWDSDWRVIDERGRDIPFQVMPAEAQAGRQPRLLFPLSAEPRQMRVLRIERRAGASAPPLRTRADGTTLSAEGGASVSVSPRGALTFAGAYRMAMPRLHLIEDASDNWTHGIDRYAERPREQALWEDEPTVLDHGACMASWLQRGRIGESTLRAEWRVYADEPYVELRLGVNWRERQTLLKMVIPMTGAAGERTDGIMGGCLVRPNSGRECPVRDWTLCRLRKGGMGVVCPDVYALDATPRRLRLTLLRSPIMSHHVPNPGTSSRGIPSDQGEHSFRFRFYRGETVAAGDLERQALMLQRPLLSADLTRGMPRRVGW